jgi:hypothetical protein
MLTPTIDIAQLSLIFSTLLAGFAVYWGIIKAITLLK